MRSYLPILFSMTIGLNLNPWFFDSAEPNLIQSINISQAVQKECTDIIEVFLKANVT